MTSAVTYEQFLISAARCTVSTEIVEMLLAREIAGRTDIGRHWTERGERARNDLADAGKWETAIKPDPVHATLQELVLIVDRALELAPATRT